MHATERKYGLGRLYRYSALRGSTVSCKHVSDNFDCVVELVVYVRTASTPPPEPAEVDSAFKFTFKFKIATVSTFSFFFFF